MVDKSSAELRKMLEEIRESLKEAKDSLKPLEDQMNAIESENFKVSQKFEEQLKAIEYERDEKLTTIAVRKNQLEPTLDLHRLNVTEIERRMRWIADDLERAITAEEEAMMEEQRRLLQEQATKAAEEKFLEATGDAPWKGIAKKHQLDRGL